MFQLTTRFQVAKQRYYKIDLGTYATIPLPLFERNQGNIQKAFLFKRQSDLILTAKQSRIKKEVVAAFQLLKIQSEILLLSEKIMIESETVLKNIQYVYLRGGASFIDYLDTQRNWYDAQKVYYGELYGYRKKIHFSFICQRINKRD